MEVYRRAIQVSVLEEKSGIDILSDFRWDIVNCQDSRKSLNCQKIVKHFIEMSLNSCLYPVFRLAFNFLPPICHTFLSLLHPSSSFLRRFLKPLFHRSILTVFHLSDISLIPPFCYAPSYLISHLFHSSTTIISFVLLSPFIHSS